MTTRPKIPLSEIAARIAADIPGGVEVSAAIVDLSIGGFWKAVSRGRLPKPTYPLNQSPRWFPSELRAALEATRALPREKMHEKMTKNMAEARAAARRRKASSDATPQHDDQAAAPNGESVQP